MKTLKFKDIDGEVVEVVFDITTYLDMFHRTAVLAYDADTGEWYDDITKNIPMYSLDEGKCFLNASCPKLIAELEKQGYLKILSEVKVNYGTYQVGEFTPKFYEDFKKEEEEE